MSEPSSKRVVFAALIGNLLVAVTKLGAAAWTGSAAMLSEGVHSLVDTMNEVLLLYGYRQARQSPDALHPFGHGRELYFWSFVVALLIFAIGAGVSVYEGILHVTSPQPLEHAWVSYLVLGLSFAFESTTWGIALRNFSRAKGELGWWEAIRRSKDPPSFMVLFEDSAALTGIVVAALGIYAADRFHQPALDGAASIVIGLVLGLVAILLARESKGLLIGETAAPAVTASIEAIAEQVAGVVRVNGMLTTHLSPSQIVVALSLEFEDELRTPDIEACVTRIEQRVTQQHPEVYALFVKPQTPKGFEQRRSERIGASRD